MFAAPAVVRADVAEFLGKPIGTVTVIAGGRPTTDPRLVGLVETEAGQPLRMAAVRESIAHLFSLGEYEVSGCTRWRPARRCR